MQHDFYFSTLILSIYPFSIITSPALRVMRGEGGVLDLVLAIFGQRRGYTLDKLPISLIIYLVVFFFQSFSSKLLIASAQKRIALQIMCVRLKKRATLTPN